MAGSHGVFELHKEHCKGGRRATSPAEFFRLSAIISAGGLVVSEPSDTVDEATKDIVVFEPWIYNKAGGWSAAKRPADGARLRVASSTLRPRVSCGGRTRGTSGRAGICMAVRRRRSTSGSRPSASGLPAGSQAWCSAHVPEASNAGTRLAAHPSRIYGPPRHRCDHTTNTMDLRPPRLYKWYKPIDEREKALDMPDLTEEQRAAMDLARPPAPSLPGAPEGEPGAAPAAAPGRRG